VVGAAVDLTAQEVLILNYFMHRRGHLISQNELIEHLYPLEEERDPNTIEVYIARLRKKLGRDVIKTQRGLGYRLGGACFFPAACARVSSSAPSSGLRSACRRRACSFPHSTASTQPP